MSIRFREDRKQYEVSVSLNGKRVRRLFKLKSKAVEFEKNPLMEIEVGTEVEPNPSGEAVELSKAIAKYYQTFVKDKKVTDGEDKRRFNLAYHYLRSQGVFLVSEVRLEHVEGLQQWLMEDHEIGEDESGEKIFKRAVCPSTVNRWFNTYRHFFKKCAQWEYLEKDPCEFLSNLSEDEFLRTPWSKHQVKAVFAKAEPWFRRILWFTYLTGIRPSTLVRLEAIHITPGSKVMLIQTRKGKERKLSFKPLPLTHRARAIIRLQKVSEGPLFTMPSGERVRADYISKKTSKLIKECGFKGISLYGLRHRLANDLLEADVATEAVRRLMAHQSHKSTESYLKNVGMDFLSKKLEQVGR